MSPVEVTPPEFTLRKCCNSIEIGQHQEDCEMMEKHPPEDEKLDMVNHPPHYTGHPKGIECIDVIEDSEHPNLANAIKYIWRVTFGSKGRDLEDLEKAKWYVQREIDRRSLRGRGTTPNEVC